MSHGVCCLLRLWSIGAGSQALTSTQLLCFDPSIGSAHQYILMFQRHANVTGLPVACPALGVSNTARRQVYTTPDTVNYLVGSCTDQGDSPAPWQC